MNDEKRSVPEQPAKDSFSVHPKVFVFFDKKTSAPRFEVKADADGKMPVDQVVGLLAMNCMLRGQTPKDYMVMVGTGENLLNGLARRASKLIQASLALSLPMQLSHRQQEVLRGVMENLSNKEIAARLNFSERTAKFHVSALLGKFNVTSRVSLMKTAGDLLAAGKLFTGDPVTQLKTREKRGTDSPRDGAHDLERRSAKSVLTKG
jgi:DNA-binding CsgD family transcriptional regulator